MMGIFEEKKFETLDLFIESPLHKVYSRVGAAKAENWQCTPVNLVNSSQPLDFLTDLDLGIYTGQIASFHLEFSCALYSEPYIRYLLFSCNYDLCCARSSNKTLCEKLVI